MGMLKISQNSNRTRTTIKTIIVTIVNPFVLIFPTNPMYNRSSKEFKIDKQKSLRNINRIDAKHKKIPPLLEYFREKRPLFTRNERTVEALKNEGRLNEI